MLLSLILLNSKPNMEIITSIGNFILTVLAYVFTIGIGFGLVWLICDSFVSWNSNYDESRKSFKVALIVFVPLVCLFTYWHFTL